MAQSTEFHWDPKDFEGLMKVNETDEAVQISLRHIPDKRAQILEAGSGTGRVVRYFKDLGYKNVHGLELNREAVDFLNKKFPDLDIIQGDILKMPYEKEKFDVIVSYGVVEHFPKLGLHPPLKALYGALKPGGVAIVTVPSLNLLRRLQHYRDLAKAFFHPRSNPWLRRLLGKSVLPPRNKQGYLYHAFPQYGDFFEYRLKPREFITACRRAGFEVEESRPIYHRDGMYHVFGEPMVEYRNWQFEMTPRAEFLNRLFRLIPFAHNHMHLCVLRKEKSLA